MQCQQLVAYAKSCAQPGLDYFQRQLGNSLVTSLAAFKGARLFASRRSYGRTVPCPFFSSEVINCLKEELPQYLARAADTSADISPIEWWKRNASDLPHWAEATRKILLLQPSSAAAERVFSLLQNSFGEQDNSLQDYIECSLMLQYNKH